MIKPVYHIIFAIIFVLELISIQFNFQLLEYFTKPSILIFILYLFIKNSSSNRPVYSKAIIAFTFSLLGDVLLMLSRFNELLFLIAVASFLISHVFFILTFNVHKTNEPSILKLKKWLIIPVVLVGITLYTVLFKHLDSVLKPAVLLYMLAISLMILSAINRYKKVNTISYVWILVGALLFLLSDSTLAVNRFWIEIPASGILIMSTYMLAQYFFLIGLLNENNPEQVQQHK